MVEIESSNCRIVVGSLAGEREVDEQTLASLAVLEGRLERLKGLDAGFSGVKFSSAVKELQSRKTAVGVG